MTLHYTICTSCRAVHSEHLSGQVILKKLEDKLPRNCAVHAVDCMAACERPVSVSIAAPEKTHYLFAEIETESDVDALIAFASDYDQSPTGWTKATERPKALLHKTVARIPSFHPFKQNHGEEGQ